MILLFWICIGLIIYAFIGYGFILFILLQIKNIFRKTNNGKKRISCSSPSCSILIAAYNEGECIRDKILNTLSLKYSNEVAIYIVADGSTDQTVQIIEEYPEINLLFNPSRNGKVAAINRAMTYISSEIVIFTDANTHLNDQALIYISDHYQDSKIGGVAGEKRIYAEKKADAAAAGENLYWKYESKLKEWDSELYSTIGAAGELFSIRTKLYEPVPNAIILDDFMISMNIIQKGFKIVYEPCAYAIETSSLNVKQELKRKIRIAAGGIQSVIKLKSLLNPFEKPLLSFQYVSHRVLRWTIIPFLLIIAFFINNLLLLREDDIIYKITLVFQLLFYLLAFTGFFLEKKQLKVKVAFIPYYFCMMNYAVIAGIFKYFQNKQSSVWEKAERRGSNNQPQQTKITRVQL